MRRALAAVLCILPTLISAHVVDAQEPVGSAFTYQGQLRLGGLSLSGDFDFRFEMYDAETDGTMLDQLDLEDVPVREGLFSVELDFGASIFNTEATWLQVGVRDGASTGSFTLLTPRSRITPSPYAIQAAEATNANSLAGLSASDFLRADGAIVASELTVSGELDVTELVFPDGTRQSTASTASLPAIDEPTTYSPAFLTCGDEPESDPAQWTFITGRFRITIDGVEYEPQAEFENAMTMDDVAADLQLGIRTVTGGQESVEWQGDHFVITSGDTTANSSITLASTPSVGIDISGASAGSNWMDCDPERAMVTESVLNGAADSGKLVLLDADGRINSLFLPINKVASSTDSVTVGDGEFEVLRFEVPGGILGDSGILRLQMKSRFFIGVNFGTEATIRAYYGDTLIATLAYPASGLLAGTYFLSADFDIMGAGSATSQKAISSGELGMDSSSRHAHDLKAVSLNSAENHELYVTVSRSGFSANFTLLAYSALVIR